MMYCSVIFPGGSWPHQNRPVTARVFPDNLPSTPSVEFMCVCACVCLTSDDSRDAPAHGVVEPHVAVVDVTQFCQHAVDVQPLHKHPGKGAHVEVMEEDGNHSAHELEMGRRGSLSAFEGHFQDYGI